MSAFALACPTRGQSTGQRPIRSKPELHRRCSRSSRRSPTRISASSGAGLSRSAAVFAFVDLVVLRFAADGTLEALEPYLAPDGGSAPRFRRAGAGAPRDRRGIQPDELAFQRSNGRESLAGSRSRGCRIVWHRRRGAGRARVRAAAAWPPAVFRSSIAISRTHAQRFCPPELCGTTHAWTLDICRASPAPTPERGSVDLWVSSHHVGPRRCAPPGPPRSARA